MSSVTSEDAMMLDAPSTPTPGALAPCTPATGRSRGKELVLATAISGTELKKLKARQRALVNKFNDVNDAIVNRLEEADPGIVLEVYFNSATQSSDLGKDFQFGQLLKLRSDNPFRLMGMVNMGQTNHSGLIAIIVKQTLPFEFMKLPKNVRERVYNHILCDEGKTIRVKTRGGTHKSSFAPAFTSLNRLAILSLNRQVREEALPILFNQKFIMETTYSLQNFLLQIDVGRKYITKIIVEMYERKTAQPAFQLLINCKQLKKLRFDHVSSNSQVPQALKVIWSDAGTWLTSFNNPGPYRKDAAAVMEILSFGSNSFHSKVMDKKTGELNVKKWGYLEHGTLIAGLKKKLTEANRRTDLEIARR